MSRQTAPSAPAASAISAAPTAPPAGPLSTVHEPWRAAVAASATPPPDSITSGLGSPASRGALAQPLEVAAQQRRQGGVDDRGGAALVLAEDAGGLVRGGHVQVVRHELCRRAARARGGGSPRAGRRPRPPRRGPRATRAARPRRARRSRRRARSAPWPGIRRSGGTSGGGWPAQRRYSSGRAWRPSSSRSVKPSVASSAVRATLPSSSAFVPTVMPCTKRSTSSAPAPGLVQRGLDRGEDALRLVVRRARRLGGDQPLAVEQRGVGERAAHVDAEEHRRNVPIEPRAGGARKAVRTREENR